jgi:hypothetical protein
MVCGGASAESKLSKNNEINPQVDFTYEQDGAQVEYENFDVMWWPGLPPPLALVTLTRPQMLVFWPGDRRILNLSSLCCNLVILL